MADKMSRISIGFVAFICIACGNNPGKTKAENELTAVVAKPIIDSLLNVGVSEIIEDGQSWVKYKSPPPPISEGCLVMIVDVNPENKYLFFSDSIIKLTYKVCGKTYPVEAYKGVLSIDSCNIAVFDESGIGERYYNSDSLKMIPFDQFKCFPMKNVPIAPYQIRNGTLHYWNP